jgi:hypothetical protein
MFQCEAQTIFLSRMDVSNEWSMEYGIWTRIIRISRMFSSTYQTTSVSLFENSSGLSRWADEQPMAFSLAEGKGQLFRDVL